MPNLDEFDNLTEALAQNADDYHIKIETVHLLKSMKDKAMRGDAMAAYRLSRVFPTNSANHLKWLKRAADKGLTNAMFDLAVVLSETNSISKLQEAASYLVQISLVQDRFIGDQVKEFLKDHRCLAGEVSRQLAGTKVSQYTSANFFSRNTSNEETRKELSNSLEM